MNLRKKNMKKYLLLSFALVLLLSCSGSIISVNNTIDLDSIIVECEKQLIEKVGKTIPGAVIVFIGNGEIYYQKAFGYKDKKLQEAMSLDTIFQVASISKPVFAITVMKLKQEGLINIDNPIDSYLQNWYLPDSKYDKNGVNARRILTHSAGLSTSGYLGYNPKKKLPTLEQSLSSFFYSVKLKSYPGEKWKYSGGGYSVLQLAVEEIIGLNLAEYAETNIFKNMGMVKSSYTYDTSMNKELAKPYNLFGIQVPNYLFSETAAAGLYTTSHDLALMIIEIMNCYNYKENNFVLSRETLELMFTPEINIDNKSSMGIGFFIHYIGNNKKTYGHGGSNQGWRAHFEFCPDKNSGIIILTNGNSGRSRLILPLLETWREYLSKK
jgi:CubicO group peptidase (beta-lactamase class C family)